MKHDVAEILKEALELPPEARAAIAGSLLGSLDQTLDEDVEAAWEEEVFLRLKDIDGGRVNLVPRAEARRRIAGK
ncbi:MAG: addiction module protein [Desulfomonilaceae bacterium]